MEPLPRVQQSVPAGARHRVIAPTAASAYAPMPTASPVVSVQEIELGRVPQAVHVPARAGGLWRLVACRAARRPAMERGIVHAAAASRVRCIVLCAGWRWREAAEGGYVTISRQRTRDWYTNVKWVRWSWVSFEPPLHDERPQSADGSGRCEYSEYPNRYGLQASG